jgi:hypothetical protein
VFHVLDPGQYIAFCNRGYVQTGNSTPNSTKDFDQSKSFSLQNRRSDSRMDPNQTTFVLSIFTLSPESYKWLINYVIALRDTLPETEAED